MNDQDQVLVKLRACVCQCARRSIRVHSGNFSFRARTSGILIDTAAAACVFDKYDRQDESGVVKVSGFR